MLDAVTEGLCPCSAEVQATSSGACPCSAAAPSPTPAVVKAVDTEAVVTAWREQRLDTKKRGSNSRNVCYQAKDSVQDSGGQAAPISCPHHVCSCSLDHPHTSIHSLPHGGLHAICIPWASLFRVHTNHVPALGSLYSLLPLLRTRFLKYPHSLLSR